MPNSITKSFGPATKTFSNWNYQRLENCDGFCHGLSFIFCITMKRKLCWCPHVETRSTAWKKHSFWYAHLLLRSRWYKKEANLLHVEFDSSGAIVCPCDLRAISFKMLCTIMNTVAPFGRSACIFCHEISYKPLTQIYGGSVFYLLPIDGHYCKATQIVGT